MCLLYSGFAGLDQLTDLAVQMNLTVRHIKMREKNGEKKKRVESKLKVEDLRWSEQEGRSI